MTDLSQHNESLGWRDLLPGVVASGRRITDIATSGLSTYLLFDRIPYSVGTVLERNARKYRDHIALLYEDRSWTYGELNAQINQLAHLFQSSGITNGDVVVVFLENRPETLLITAALAKLGATASLINSNIRKQALTHSIELKYSRYFCIGEEVIDAFEAIRTDLDLSDETMYWIRDNGRINQPTGYIDLEKEAGNYSRSNVKSAKRVCTADHLAYIFTSGTTGFPKASIQTHKQWLRSMHWFGKINLAMKPEDILYLSIPFYHANALMIAWPSVFGAGATLAMRRKFSVREFWQDIRKFNATSFIYIGEICRYLINAPANDLDKQHRVLKIIGNGMRPDIWENFKMRFGIEKIFEFYGASDSNIIFTNTFNANSTVGWSPASYAIIEYDIDTDQPILDRKGRMIKVKTGETGLMISEITRMFPFSGYVNKRHNEEKVFRHVFKKGDQWFNTGDMMKDIGYGHVQFVDRLGDTFRWKGENVATAEVEQVINVMGFVESCAVYGVQISGCDGRAGMVAIIPNREIQADDLEEFTTTVRKHLATYAIPLFLRITSEFEQTHTHKIRKNKLKEEGFDPNKIIDRVYVLIPGSKHYRQLTGEICNDILNGKLSF